MKSLTRLVVVALLLPTMSATANADDGKVFTVGVIAPLTGALAENGLATRNGIELAKKRPKLVTE